MTEYDADSFQQRSSTPLRLQKMQWWIGYAQTPGLESYRKVERYSAWWYTHCQLKKHDAIYATECRRFYVQQGFALLLAIGLFFTLRIGYSSGLATLMAVTAAASVSFLFCASEQRRRNAWIGRQFTAEPVLVG